MDKETRVRLCRNCRVQDTEHCLGEEDVWIGTRFDSAKQVKVLCPTKHPQSFLVTLSEG